MDCSSPGSSVHGILQARKLERVAIPSFRGSSQPRDRHQVSWTAGGFFPIWATSEACCWLYKPGILINCALEWDLPSFPGGARGKKPACQCRICKRREFDPWVGKIPWRRAWQPTLVFLPEESHGQRSLDGYSPWGCKELIMPTCSWTILKMVKVVHCYVYFITIKKKKNCREKANELGFPGGSEVKASAWNEEEPGSIPGSGRSPGEGNGNPLQYSCLENPMEGEAW